MTALDHTTYVRIEKMRDKLATECLELRQYESTAIERHEELAARAFDVAATAMEEAKRTLARLLREGR